MEMILKDNMDERKLMILSILYDLQALSYYFQVLMSISTPAKSIEAWPAKQAAYLSKKEFTDSRLNQFSRLKKSQRMSFSRKSMAKEGSSETFETDLPFKLFEKGNEEGSIFGVQTLGSLRKKIKSQWNPEKKLFQNEQLAKTKSFMRHRKTYSASYPLNHSKSAKTEVSLIGNSLPINIENFITEFKTNKLSFSRSNDLPRSTLTINQIMINKFQPRRQYENSKIIRNKMLPSFLNFSISKCRLHEKSMTATIESNLFKRYEVSYHNKSNKN